MASNVKLNGVWKTATNYYVKTNGTWKTVTYGYVKVNGTWKTWLTPDGPSYYSPPAYYASPSYFATPVYYSSGGCGSYYSIPNLVGLTTSQAISSIQSSGNIVGSTNTTTGGATSNNDGFVASQSPSAGTYCGQQTVNITSYSWQAPSYYATPAYYTVVDYYAPNPCGACGDGGSVTTTQFYCQGGQRWSRQVTTFYDGCDTSCSSSTCCDGLEVSCSPSCGCGGTSYYAAPTYYALPITYYASPTYYAAPIYYTSPTYYAAPIYYSPNTSVTYYAAPIYYTPNTSVTYYAAPSYVVYYYASPTYYAAPVYVKYYYASPVYYSSGGGGGGCWAYETLVTLSNGSKKFIEDVVVGDKLLAPVIPTYPNGEDNSLWYPGDVWSLTDDSGITYEETTVTAVKHIIENSYYILNDAFKVTGDHFVFASKSGVWQFAKVEELEVGDLLRREDGNTVEITKKQGVAGKAMVVDIDVEQNDLFIANGIITHNIKLAM